MRRREVRFTAEVQMHFSYGLVVCMLITACCSLLFTPGVRAVPLLRNRLSSLIMYQNVSQSGEQRERCCVFSKTSLAVAVAIRPSYDVVAYGADYLVV